MRPSNRIRNLLFSRRMFIGKSVLGGAAVLVGNVSRGAAAETPLTGALTARDGQRVDDALSLSATGSVQISGWIGEKLDNCLSRRVMKQKLSDVVDPFRERKDGDGGFRGEFWGKWFTSAVLGYAYRPTFSYREVLDQAIQSLLETQSPDGYIGTCDEDHQLAAWDIWGRKYVMLGLLAYYDQTGNTKALSAARREADFLMTQVGPGKVNIADASLDVLKGLPSSSVLEPIALLYQRTGDNKYLKFAEYIVAQWSKPSKYAPAGIRLIEDALAGTPPLKIDSPKGYEMMSCFEGVCELYRATGNTRYLDAALKFGESIRSTELMVDGSGSNQELWCNGAVSQTSTLEQPQETCVTVTWMKFCCQLLRLTGDSRWADDMEVSLYNALAGAMMPDGDWWAYYSQINGQRMPSPVQFTQLSCCVANGPRALMLTPRWAVMDSSSGPVVNVYASGTATSKLADGSTVKLTQQTDYPVSQGVSIWVDPSTKHNFTLRLRIPAWSQNTNLSVNGEALPCIPGTYVSITRSWSAGDRIELQLDLTPRAIPAPSGAPQFAVMRGPVLLALDSRFVTPLDTAVHLLVDDAHKVSLTERKIDRKDVWMAYDVNFEVRPSHFFDHKVLPLTMIDFASAGNQWSDDNPFRTWLPQPLLLSDAFPKATWKLMLPGTEKRPIKPESI